MSKQIYTNVNKDSSAENWWVLNYISMLINAFINHIRLYLKNVSQSLNHEWSLLYIEKGLQEGPKIKWTFLHKKAMHKIFCGYYDITFMEGLRYVIENLAP